MIGIEHPAIYVTDLEISIDFYQKLGFKILRKTNRPHAMMYLGNDIIEIMPRLDELKNQGFSPPFPYHLALHTDNIEEDVARLQEEGIETGEIVTFSDTRLENLLAGVVEYAEPNPDNPKLFGCMKPSENWRRVAIKDPDGIDIEIWQRN